MERPICVLGNANLDLVLGAIDTWPEPGTEMFLPRSDMRIGGSAANTALVLDRLGVSSGLVSACGSDLPGGMIANRFRGELDRVPRLAGATGISVGVLFSDAERSFLSVDGHLAHLDLDFFLAQLDNWPLEGSIALVSGAFALPALLTGQEALIDHLRLAGAEVAIDPGWPGEGWTSATRAAAMRWIAKSDHVLLNDKEVCALAGNDGIDAACEALNRHIRKTTRLVVKCGADGVVCRSRGHTVRVQAPRREVFDTVGAGDAFNAGYLAAVAKNATLGGALATGARVAADVISEFPRSQEPINMTEITHVS